MFYGATDLSSYKTEVSSKKTDDVQTLEKQRF